MEAPANQIPTCVKGKFGWDFVNSPDRLVQPLIRRGDVFEPASWDEAMEYAAAGLKKIRGKYGPDSIGYISSSKCTNEENYLMQKFARAVMGTNSIDNCSRYCQTPTTEGLHRTMGLGGDNGSWVGFVNGRPHLVVNVGLVAVVETTKASHIPFALWDGTAEITA